MSPRYRVTLTEQERNELDTLTTQGKTSARKFMHARTLLLCDAGVGGPAWKVADTAEALPNIRPGPSNTSRRNL